MHPLRADTTAATRLQAVAEVLSSANDPELAAWQEDGLARRRSPARVIVWAIAGTSVIAGLLVVAVGVWFVVKPTLGLAPALASPRRTDHRAGILIILAALITGLAGGAVAFALFQMLSRLSFTVLGRPQV